MDLSDEIVLPFISSTLSILEVMAGMKAQPGVPYLKTTARADGDISAIVVVTGDRTGSIAVSFTRPCALFLVRSMLGDAIENVLQDTQDAVGEITNMVSGQARAVLAEKGIVIQGSTPAIIVGSTHQIRHTASGPVVAIPFSSEAGSFTVEFCLE